MGYIHMICKLRANFFLRYYSVSEAFKTRKTVKHGKPLKINTENR